MTRAVRGDWWLSAKGAVYCVAGTSFGDQGLSGRVDLYWLTNHDPPQVHRLKLYPGQWSKLTAAGTRIDGPPTHNTKGCSFGPAAAAVVAAVACGAGGER